tara:strand:- start:27 stop:206 length:180 start_codon:yes stop_codon:yes gene_type:complete
VNYNMQVKYIKDIDTNENINVMVTHANGTVIYAVIKDGTQTWEMVKEWVADGNTIEEAD